MTLGFAAGDDGLQEQMVVCFHVGHKMHVAVDSDNQNPLAWVTSLAWMFQHIQEFSGFMRQALPDRVLIREGSIA